MESLHLSFQWVVDAGMFMGIKLSPSLNLSHMFYADDAVFVGQWCDGNINTLVHVLECFYRASGLRINMSKSKIMGVHVEDENVKHAASKLGCLILNSPFSYLGTKVRIYVSGASLKRRLLIRVPSSVLRMLESIRSQFFNGHELGSNKATWVKWNSVLASKEKGGLDVSSLYALNRGLMLKWVWRFFNQKTSLWAKVIKAIHGEDEKVWSLESSGEFSVASIRKVIDEKRLSIANSMTRWVKYVPIKVNVLAWKVKIDALPTRLNISRRETDYKSKWCSFYLANKRVAAMCEREKGRREEVL
nr:RNA-directed DNA polymerase, eukaryota, reverse transcriptase zinc-binding domain protein [Tanacetum cinerariifolium]